MKKSPFKIIGYQNKKDALDELVRVKPQIIFTDDDLKRLKFAQEIKNKIDAKNHILRANSLWLSLYCKLF